VLLKQTKKTNILRENTTPNGCCCIQQAKLPATRHLGPNSTSICCGFDV